MTILEKIFPCLRKKQTAKLAPISYIEWTDQEVEILEKIKDIRNISPHNELKHLAEKRLIYQQALPSISHSDFYGDSTPYKEEFGWTRVAELLAYKFINPVSGFMASEAHSKYLLDEDLDYVGVAYDGARCVVILGRK